jgi:hypothetical protein
VVVVLREDDLTVVARFEGSREVRPRLKQYRGRLGFVCARKKRIDVGA